MLKNYNFLPLIACSLFFFSCNFLSDVEKKDQVKPEDFNQVNGPDYSISLPKYMRMATNLNDEASLQYQNLFKETYVIVLDEDIADAKNSLMGADYYDEERGFLENYVQFSQDYFLDSLDELEYKTGIKDTLINGLTAKKVETVGKVPEVNISIAYWHTYYQSANKVFYLLSWTLAERKQTYDGTFNQIRNSFKTNASKNRGLPMNQ